MIFIFSPLYRLSPPSHRLEAHPTEGPRADNPRLDICRLSEASQSCKPRKTRSANVNFPRGLLHYRIAFSVLSSQFKRHALTDRGPKLASSYHELLEYVASLRPKTCLKDSTKTIAHYREFSSKELRTVGNYTLGRLIGKGSFGKVYLASHKLTNGSKVGLMLLASTSVNDVLQGGAQIS